MEKIGEEPVCKTEIVQESNEEYASNSKDVEMAPDVDVKHDYSNELLQSFQKQLTFPENGSDAEIDKNEMEITNPPYEQLFVKENYVGNRKNDDSQDVLETNSDSAQHEILINAVGEQIPENESDNDDYQVVEGLHVTGDTEMQEFSLQSFDSLEEQDDKNTSQSQVLKVQRTYPNKKLLKTVIKNVKIKKVYSPADNSKVTAYYIFKKPEKENLAETTLLNKNPVVKTNPRSILKSSYQPVEIVKVAKPEEKFEKRFAKSKEAIQAKQFHNFIAQTTILHAPVRQERLPRKQKIKPVNRVDEEIIVQEVVVSSNGFVETKEDGVVKERTPLKPSVYIHLTDSDDDYDPKKSKKQGRKYRKRKPHVQITISDDEDDDVDNDDDEDSEESVIEIDSDDSYDPKNQSHNNLTPKRRRGRPPKQSNTEVNRSMESNKNYEVPESSENKISPSRKRGRPPKQIKNVEAVASRNISKNNNSTIKSTDLESTYKCTKCSKTFPSQGSLKTHLQYHKMEANMKNLRSSSAKSNEREVVEYKYKCKDCTETFKNNALLTRHIATHAKSSINCILCKKQFNSTVELNSHKKTHLKEQMCKTSTLIFPTKIYSKDNKTKNFKCSECSKKFSSLVLLSTHTKIHKQFTCMTCGSSFSSQHSFHVHIREKCVKSPLLSKTQKKSSPDQGTSLNKNSKHSLSFPTFRPSTNQKKDTKALNTPKKSVPGSATKHKQRNVHCGVPASEKVQKAYDSLLQKLNK